MTRSMLLGIVTCTAMAHSYALQTTLADWEGDPSLLESVIAAWQENRTSLQTWQGGGTVTHRTSDEEGALIAESASISYWYDEQRQAKRWSWNVDQRRERTESGLQVAEAHPSESEEIVTLDRYIRHAHGMNVGGDWFKTVVIWPREEAAERSRGLYSFDPMFYWDRHGRDIPGYLRHHIENWGNPEMTPARVYREGQLVVMELVGDTVRNRFVFDMEKGGNVVEYTASDSRRSGTFVWTYEQRDGVWVPATLKRTVVENGEGSSETREIEVTFGTNAVNQLIDESVFTVEGLGVAPGTRVTDHILNLAYDYGGTTGLDKDLSLEGLDAGTQAADTNSGREPSGLLGRRAGEPGDTSGDAAGGRFGGAVPVWLIASMVAGGVLVLLFVALMMRRRINSGKR